MPMGISGVRLREQFVTLINYLSDTSLWQDEQFHQATVTAFHSCLSTSCFLCLLILFFPCLFFILIFGIWAFMGMISFAAQFHFIFQFWWYPFSTAWLFFTFSLLFISFFFTTSWFVLSYLREVFTFSYRYWYIFISNGDWLSTAWFHGCSVIQFHIADVVCNLGKLPYNAKWFK